MMMVGGWHANHIAFSNCMGIEMGYSRAHTPDTQHIQITTKQQILDKNDDGNYKKCYIHHMSLHLTF